MFIPILRNLEWCIILDWCRNNFQDTRIIFTNPVYTSTYDKVLNQYKACSAIDVGKTECIVSKKLLFITEDFMQSFDNVFFVREFAIYNYLRENMCYDALTIKDSQLWLERCQDFKYLTKFGIFLVILKDAMTWKFLMQIILPRLAKSIHIYILFLASWPKR